MRSIKGILFAVVGLFTVITLFSLLMPSKVMTVRTVVIHTDSTRAFNEIEDLGRWRYWHPVFMQDSAAIQLSNPSSGVNAFAEWESNGKKNRLTIIGNDHTTMQASLSRPAENDVWNIITVSSLKDSNNVQVEWRTFTKLKWYPWEKFSGIFIDKVTGPGYEAALNNLKVLIEGKQ